MIPPIDPIIVTALREARRVVALTGAGISAEGGIATFRDQQTGLWERFDALELATPQAFARNPSLVWGWYEWRRAAVLAAEPNPGHRVLAAMASKVPEFTLITQNVDDLHERAGGPEPIHLHGRLAAPYCESCRWPHTLASGRPDLPPGGARIEPPRCAHCGARVRPGVVWFGESLPEREWRAACAAAGQCDVFFCIGTSSVVQPAASLIDLAIGARAVTIQVNPQATTYDGAVTASLRGPAGEVLPALLESAWGN